MPEVYGRASSDYLIVTPSPPERALLRKEADKEVSSSASTTVRTPYMFRDAMLKYRITGRSTSLPLGESLLD
jgi:hypothetical protein